MRRSTPALALFLCLVIAFQPIQARQDQLSCGTHGDVLKQALHLHQASSRQWGVKFGALSAAERAAAAERYALADRGDIAIMSDADGVVARQKEFDLRGKTLRLLRTDSTQFRYESLPLAYDAAASASGTLLPLEDDDSTRIDIPFSFPFFAQSYRTVWVNSDGNLTFEGPDTLSGARSLGRFTAGLPRVSPLFTDLDPSRASDGVRVLATASRVVVTWSQVPEFVTGGTGSPNTFQVALYPDGRIEFSYSTIVTQDAIVGVSPGRVPGGSTLVSFSSPSSKSYGGALAERFSSVDEIDIFTAAQKFYLNHDDAYDYLAFYNVAGVDADLNAVAYEVTVRNNRTGYGDLIGDSGFITGSGRRLQAILNMGPLSQYPTDPSAPVPLRSRTGDTPLTILGHEIGHLFLAYASVADEDNPDGHPMLGRDGQHWAFTFNSDASLLEGNRIEDGGPNVAQRFKTTATVQGYSALDQYLMGFRAKDDVPPTFYVRNATVSTSRPPQTGVGFNGVRRDVAIDEVIERVGRRTPDYTVSQRRFRVGFVLIVPDGQEPTAEQLQQVERLRANFPTEYDRWTSGAAAAETNLAKALHVSVFPAAGVVVGSSVNATVTLDSAAQAAVPLLIRTRTGTLRAADAVTIPAGAPSATFAITGVREGVDDLIVEAAVSGYESAYSRVQVANGSATKLVVTRGDGQANVPGQQLPSPVEVRLTDANGLPYSGVSINADAGSGASVSPASAVTGQDGTAQFRWTPASGNTNTLRLTAATGASVLATTVARPAVSKDAVVNGASFRAGIAPGSLATAFGSNLAGANAANVQVAVNGIATWVSYAGPGQVNFYVPPSVSAGTASVVVTTSAGASAPVEFPVSAAAPGIFFDAASGYGAVLNNGSGSWTGAIPAARGGYIEIYATGLASATLDRVTATLSGVPIPVVYAGNAPGFTGLDQINAQIPDGAASGDQTLTVSVNGVLSNTVKIRVQ